jgi:hypothetical protein
LCERVVSAPDLATTKIGDNALSSIDLGTCGGVRFCTEPDFRGGCLYFRKGHPDLSATRMGDNQASSFECTDGSFGSRPPDPNAGPRGQAQLCSDADYKGRCETLTLSPALAGSKLGNDTASSLKLGTCRMVKVCTNFDFGGTCVTLGRDVPSFGGTPVGDDSVSSVECIGEVTEAGEAGPTTVIR